MEELWSPFSNVYEDINVVASCIKFDPTKCRAVVSASPCSDHFWKVWLGEYYFFCHIFAFRGMLAYYLKARNCLCLYHFQWLVHYFNFVVCCVKECSWKCYE